MSNIIEEDMDLVSKILEEKSYYPFSGKDCRLVRELYVDLDKLPNEAIVILSNINKNMKNIYNYTFNIDNTHNFDKFPSYKDRDNEEVYREGLFVIDFGIFSICMFIDIFNLESKICLGLFIVHYKF